MKKAFFLTSVLDKPTFIGHGNVHSHSPRKGCDRGENGKGRWQTDKPRWAHSSFLEEMQDSNIVNHPFHGWVFKLRVSFPVTCKHFSDGILACPGAHFGKCYLAEKRTLNIY